MPGFWSRRLPSDAIPQLTVEWPERRQEKGKSMYGDYSTVARLGSEQGQKKDDSEAAPPTQGGSDQKDDQVLDAWAEHVTKVGPRMDEQYKAMQEAGTIPSPLPSAAPQEQQRDGISPDTWGSGSSDSGESDSGPSSGDAGLLSLLGTVAQDVSGVIALLPYVLTGRAAEAVAKSVASNVASRLPRISLDDVLAKLGPNAAVAVRDAVNRASDVQQRFMAAYLDPKMSAEEAADALAAIADGQFRERQAQADGTYEPDEMAAQHQGVKLQTIHTTATPSPVGKIGLSLAEIVAANPEAAGAWLRRKHDALENFVEARLQNAAGLVERFGAERPAVPRTSGDGQSGEQGTEE